MWRFQVCFQFMLVRLPTLILIWFGLFFNLFRFYSIICNLYCVECKLKKYIYINLRLFTKQFTEFGTSRLKLLKEAFKHDCRLTDW